MLTSRTSRWVAVTGTACVLILLASWFLLISPRRAHAAELVEQHRQEVAQAQSLTTRIKALKAQFGDLPATQAELAAIQAAMPSTQDMPNFIRDLSAYTKRTGLELNSITPGAPRLLGGTGAAAAGAPAATPAAGATPGATVPQDLQLYGIDVSVSVQGPYFSVAQFLKQLQTELRRTVLVTSLKIGQAEKALDGTAAPDGDVGVTLVARVFALRKADGTTVAPAAPTAAPTPTPAPTPGSAVTPSPTTSPTAGPTPTATPGPTTTPQPAPTTSATVTR